MSDLADENLLASKARKNTKVKKAEWRNFVVLDYPAKERFVGPLMADVNPRTPDKHRPLLRGLSISLVRKRSNGLRFGCRIRCV
jgi:hypothetical protein